MNPENFEDFREEVYKLYGREINAEIEKAIKDFWDHRDEFVASISDDSITLLTNMNILSKHAPAYRKYHAVGSLGILFLIIGILALIFSYVVGGIIIVIGILLRSISKYIKKRDGDNFIQEFINEVKANGFNGIPKICTLYISELIRLQGSEGGAHWPQYPSDVFSGSVNLIAS